MLVHACKSITWEAEIGGPALSVRSAWASMSRISNKTRDHTECLKILYCNKSSNVCK